MLICISVLIFNKIRYVNFHKYAKKTHQRFVFLAEAYSEYNIFNVLLQKYKELR